MSRKPDAIILNESDQILLANLLESADPNLSRRAQIIIECSKGYNNKEVSERVGMNRMNVAHWRKAFLENGINGLISKHGGGASPKVPIDDFDITLDTLLDDKSIEWTAETLAQETGASLNMVYYALKKRGISLQRKRQWFIPTQDEVIPKTLDIVGLYISKEKQAMLVCCSSSPIITSKGELITRSKELYDDFETYKGTISLANAINTSVERVQNVLQQRSMSLFEFLSETMAVLPSTSDYEYHLFIHSQESKPYRSDRIRNVYQISAADSAEWLSFVKQKISELGDRSQLNSVSNLYTAIHGYLQKSSDTSSPLIWRKVMDGVIDQNAPQAIETSNPVSDEFCHKMGEFLKSNLPSAGKDEATLRIGFITFASIQDEIMVSFDENPQNSLSVQNLPLETNNDYTEALTTMEAEIIKVRNIAGKHSIEMGAELLKKNSQRPNHTNRSRE